MKKILVIEDNKSMQDNTVEILELANYKVIVADNGKAGVKLATEEKPDLVICDIMMPELDGYGVLYLLSQNPFTAGIPFIFLSAKTDEEDIRKGMCMGADDYLTKPFDGTDLLNSVEARLKKNEIFKKEFSRHVTGINEFFSLTKSMEELKLLSTNKKPRLIKKKEVIYMEGDEAINVVFISKGKVKTCKMNKDGKELITGLYAAGDFIGSLDMIENKSYKETAISMDDSEIIIIPKLDFYNLLYSNRDVAVRFIHLLANNMDEMEERLLNIAFGSVRKRVADSLIRIQKKFANGSGNSILSITRTDLANVTGIAPETISRTLHDFKSERLINFKDKKIEILNSERLVHMKD